MDLAENAILVFSEGLEALTFDEAWGWVFQSFSEQSQFCRPV